MVFISINQFNEIKEILDRYKRKEYFFINEQNIERICKNYEIEFKSNFYFGIEPVFVLITEKEITPEIINDINVSYSIIKQTFFKENPRINSDSSLLLSQLGLFGDGELLDLILISKENVDIPPEIPIEEFETLNNMSYSQYIPEKEPLLQNFLKNLYFESFKEAKKTTESEPDEVPIYKMKNQEGYEYEVKDDKKNNTITIYGDPAKLSMADMLRSIMDDDPDYSGGLPIRDR